MPRPPGLAILAIVMVAPLVASPAQPARADIAGPHRPRRPAAAARSITAGWPAATRPNGPTRAAPARARVRPLRAASGRQDLTQAQGGQRPPDHGGQAAQAAAAAAVGQPVPVPAGREGIAEAQHLQPRRLVQRRRHPGRRPHAALPAHRHRRRRWSRGCWRCCPTCSTISASSGSTWSRATATSARPPATTTRGPPPTSASRACRRAS